MNIRAHILVSLLAASMLLAVGGAAEAVDRFAPQYGGQPMGNLFTPPQDMRMASRRSAQASYAQPSGVAAVSDNPRAPENVGSDQFNPDVWAARQEARQGRSPLRSRSVRVARTNQSTSAVEEVLPEPALDGNMQGDVQYEASGEGGEEWEEYRGDGEFGDDGDCECGHCDRCCNNGCAPCYICFPCPSAAHILVFGGVHGFKNARDGGVNGNFGFQEGVNVSGPVHLVPWFNLGYQLGFQAVQSNLHGTMQNTGTRDQKFVTAGLFHRQPVGFQAGLAFDWLRDENQDRIDLNQVRGEISLVNYHQHEIGVTAIHNSNNGSDSQSRLNWTTVDQYVAFYRWHFDNGGSGRLWGGVTGDHDGIFGGDAMLPLNDYFSLSVFSNYLIPNQGRGTEGAAQESWNIGINLVLHWKCDARTMGCSLYRPMFDVANNGTMIVDRADRQ